MNTREQYLQKRVESLEGQLLAAMQVMDVMDETYTLLGSVACGFAWDLVTECWIWNKTNNEQFFFHGEMASAPEKWEIAAKEAEALMKLERTAAGQKP